MAKQVPVYKTEVLIIGAGPAGCATALSLLTYSDTKVMVVEQGDFSDFRVGEQVSATIFKFIDYLKLTEDDFSRQDYMPSYSSVSYWGSNRPSSHDAIFTTEESTYQLNREAFDLALVQKVSDLGGVIFPRTRVKSIQQSENSHWELELNHPEQGALTIQAKYLVDGTGRNSRICRQLNVELIKHDNLMAAGCFFTLPKTKQYEFGHIIESCDDGWWYGAHLPDNKMVVSLFSDADIISNKRFNLLQQWQEKLISTFHLMPFLQGAGATLNTAKPWVRNACSQTLNSALPNNFVAVGDAACAFDPISSMGIGFAVSSGCQAAVTIINNKSDATSDFCWYQNDLKAIFSDYLITHKAIYQKELRWPESSFWKRRQTE